ncbi:MAG: hypothetical protein ACHQQ3_11700 [Gemmatimonadales bacterium]
MCSGRGQGARPGAPRLVACATLVALMTAGCIHASATPFPEVAHGYAPLPVDSVREFRAARELDSIEFVVIGQVDAEAPMTRTERDVLDEMRRKAGEMGANGMLLKGFEPLGKGDLLEFLLFRWEPSQRGHALALRVIGPKSRAQPPAPGAHAHGQATR